MKPETIGFQKPLIGKGKPVRMAMISSTPAGLVCSCGGWASRHPRKKVREDGAEKHINKAHGGRGIWL